MDFEGSRKRQKRGDHEHIASHSNADSYGASGIAELWIIKVSGQPELRWVASEEWYLEGASDMKKDGK